MMRRALRFFFAAAAFALAAGAAFASGGAASAHGAASAPEEKSLLAPDGTLYSVRSGYASDLGLTDPDVSASDYVVAWSSRRQDGSVAQGVVPDTAGHSLKRDLQLAYDEPTGSLVLLWKEDFTVLNVLRLGIFRSGAWTLANLLPNLGFAHAYNPQMLLSHQTVSIQNEDGTSASHTRTILSVIWWEEAQYVQARFAPIFLDEVSEASDVQVYDLPTSVGGGGVPTLTDERTPGAYSYPALQIEGIGGAILASFADLGSNKHYVIRVTFPSSLGKPGPDNVTWQRRRIPVVGVASEGPISDSVPGGIDRVITMIGASYHPTLMWRTEGAVGFSRFDGKAWSSARTIPLDTSMTYDRALRLVQEMATRN
jgi:hypothetical protein